MAQDSAAAWVPISVLHRVVTSIVSCGIFCLYLKPNFFPLEMRLGNTVAEGNSPLVWLILWSHRALAVPLHAVHGVVP